MKQDKDVSNWEDQRSLLSWALEVERLREDRFKDMESKGASKKGPCREAPVSLGNRGA